MGRRRHSHISHDLRSASSIVAVGPHHRTQPCKWGGPSTPSIFLVLKAGGGAKKGGQQGDQDSFAKVLGWVHKGWEIIWEAGYNCESLKAMLKRWTPIYVPRGRLSAGERLIACLPWN